jgi:large subunit ribosomal protein L12
MEYVYSALLLHSAKKEINEAHVTAILKAAGVNADSGRVKALCAALDGADIGSAIKNATAMPVAVAAPAGGHAAAAPKAEEKPEEKGVTEEEAAAGLGALFG